MYVNITKYAFLTRLKKKKLKINPGVQNYCFPPSEDLVRNSLKPCSEHNMDITHNSSYLLFSLGLTDLTDTAFLKEEQDFHGKYELYSHFIESLLLMYMGFRTIMTILST